MKELAIGEQGEINGVLVVCREAEDVGCRKNDNSADYCCFYDRVCRKEWCSRHNRSDNVSVYYEAVSEGDK